jgi:hypothetical protein
VISKSCVTGATASPLEHATNQLDQMAREVRKVAESFVLDRVAFAVAAAQQMGLVDLVLIGPPCGYYMNPGTRSMRTLGARRRGTRLYEKLQVSSGASYRWRRMKDFTVAGRTRDKARRSFDKLAL